MAEPRAKVREYTASVGADGRVNALGESILPPESWAPEHLVLAGLVCCSLTSLSYHARRVGIEVVGSGQASGTVTNRSGVEQKDLVLYCVARRGGHIVAAGRGAIPRLKAGKKLPFHIFFIGSPRAAKLSIEAPPTELEPG